MIIEDKVSAVVDIVCEQYNISAVLIKSRSRKSTVREARQLAMHFVHKHTGMSLNKSAKQLNRHHTTLLHANKVIENERATNKTYFKNYAFINGLIINKING